MIVYIRDAVEIGYCVKGIKEFCKRYNIDFRSFVAHGIDSDVLLNTGDAMALKVVERAKLNRMEGE
jgi:hypothetical protein